jgi:hypothetical protein
LQGFGLLAFCGIVIAMANPRTTEPEVTDPAPALEPAAPKRPEALVTKTADGLLCRPPPGVGIATLGPVVIGNWFGHIDGKSVTVEHGTPVRGLPADVLKRVRETPEQKIGLYDPRKPAGTQALVQPI